MYNIHRKKGSRAITALDYFSDSVERDGAVKTAAESLIQFERSARAFNRRYGNG